MLYVTYNSIKLGGRGIDQAAPLPDGMNHILESTVPEDTVQKV